VVTGNILSCVVFSPFEIWIQCNNLC